MSITPVPKDIEDDIFKFHNYSKAQLKSDIQHIKKWLLEQEHLPQCKMSESDSFLSAYLVGCKGSLEITKAKLDAYYTARHSHQITFGKLDPEKPEVLKCREYLDCFILPEAAPDGGRLCFIRLRTPDLDVYNFAATIETVLLIMEQKLRSESIPAGDYYILDTKPGFTPGHILRLNATIVRDTIIYLQKVLPWRLKAMVFINAPSFIEVAVNTLIKAFMRKKLREKILVTEEGLSYLQSKFPLRILPKDYGGEAPSCRELSDSWMDKVKAERDWYEKFGQQTTDETKRINNNGIQANALFGVQGSLKKLCVD